MPKIKVYYEEDATVNMIVPQKMIIWFGRGAIQWDKAHFYVPLKTPFKRFLAEGYNADTMSISIEQADMIRSLEKEEKLGPTFGIYIPYVVERMERMKLEKIKELQKMGIDEIVIDQEYDYRNAEQFILQISDIEDVMQMNIGPFFSWQ
jgi:hypothetical protein